MKSRSDRFRIPVLKTNLIIAIFLLLGVFEALSGVNIKNGNFYISYTDIILNSDRDIEITRTYNSKSTASGWFGNGWGSYFETNLMVTPENTIEINEYGGGSKRIYRSSESDMQAIAEGVDKIIEVALEQREVESPEEIINLKNELLESEEKRISRWRRYLSNGWVEPIQLEAGVRYYSTACGCPGTAGGSYMNIMVTDSGYVRDKQDGNFEYFSEEGNIIKVEKPGDQYIIDLKYDDNGLLQQIADNEGNKLDFRMDANKHILSIISNDTDTAIYRYESHNDEGRANLIYSKDIGGNVYEYSYDKRYNMTRISYADSTTQEMNYDTRTGFISQIKFRDNSREEYEYPMKSGDEYGTIQRSYDSAGLMLESFEKWYIIGTTEEGTRWTKKTIEIVDETDTLISEYNDFTKLPEKIFKEGIMYHFQFNLKGVLEKLVSTAGDDIGIFFDDEKNIEKLVISEKEYFLEFNDDNKVGTIRYQGNNYDYPFSEDVDGSIKEDIEHAFTILNYGMIDLN